MNPFSFLNNFLEGHQLVEASAGTGKTRTLTVLYLRLVLERRLPVRNILVLTFTNAATDELKRRIREILGQAARAFEQEGFLDPPLSEIISRIQDREEARAMLSRALHSLDEAAIFTIHGFCQRVLQERAFESASWFESEVMTSQHQLLQEIADDYWRLHCYEAPFLFHQYLETLKLSPESLVRLLLPSPSSPNLRLLPARQGFNPTQIHLLEDRLLLAFGSARQEWGKSREALKQLLLNHRGLHRGKYSKSIIENALREADLYFSSRITMPIPEPLGKFRPGSLSDGANKGSTPPENVFFDSVEELFQARKQLTQAYGTYLLELKLGLFDYARAELRKRKQQHAVRSFDDLLLDVYEALNGDRGDSLAGAIRENYQAVLVDEFQDTDPVQYFILRRVYSDPAFPLFLIGDPKQAIYSFRGADVFTYMKAAEETVEHSTLEKNWRSSPRLVKAVNSLFQRSAHPFVFPGIQFSEIQAGRTEQGEVFLWAGNPDFAPLKIWLVPRPPGHGSKGISDTRADELIPAVVAWEIAVLLEAGNQNVARYSRQPLSCKDIAVLVRTNRQARKIQEALQERRIPSLLYTNESVFASHEALELERVLRGILERGNESRVKAALATDLLGLDGNVLAGLEEDEAAWDEWLRAFAEYSELWAEEGFLLMARTLMKQHGLRRRLLAFPDGERRLTNLLHLFELLHQAALDNQLGMEGLLKWLVDRRLERQEVAPEEYQLRLETDEQAVKVITIHKSKGLEFPVVFCPYSWDTSTPDKEIATFHDPNDKTNLIKDLGSPDFEIHQIAAWRESLSENARLLYVALTRAQCRCYLVWGPFNGAATSALAYLLHPPAGGGSEWTCTDMESQFKNLSDQEMEHRLKELVQTSGDSIELRPWPESAPAPGWSAERLAGPYQCRRFKGGIVRDWRISSFTSLVSQSHAALELPDYDFARTGLTPHRQQAVPGPASQRTLFEFPRGARAGNFLHDVLQHLDFPSASSEESRSLVRQKLVEYGFDLEWEVTVGRMLQDLASLSLSQTWKLSQVTASERLHELEFMLPLDRLTPQRLRQAMADSSGADCPADFLQSLQQLDFIPSRGWMRGFLDLVVQKAGRFYILDWKSNYLGDQVEAYHSRALRQVIIENYYFIQYCLYTVALHRFLRFRLENYEYDSMFGGVFYVFLRGIDPLCGPECGVFFDRPAEGLIQSLDRVLTEYENRGHCRQLD